MCVRKPSPTRHHPCTPWPFSLSDPARITIPCVPPCRPVRCVNRLFHPYLLSALSASDATRRERGRRVLARRRIGVATSAAATRREGRKGHVGYLAVPCESVCASYVARQSTRRLRRVRGGLNINADARPPPLPPPPPSPPQFLSGTPRVPDASHAPVGFSAEGGPDTTQTPFLHSREN